MNGQGYVLLDVLLFLLTLGAAGVQAYYFPSWCRQGAGLLRALRFAGWAVLATRFGTVLVIDGDILISLPSIIALSFLAAGELTAIAYRGRSLKL